MPVGVTGLYHSSDLVGFPSFCLSVSDQETATFIHIKFENKDLTVLCPNNDRNCSCLCLVNIGLLKPVQHMILTVANQKRGIHAINCVFYWKHTPLRATRQVFPVCLSSADLNASSPSFQMQSPSSPHIWYQSEMPFVRPDQQPDASQDSREGWILLSVLSGLEVALALFHFVLISRDAQAVPLFLKEQQTNKPTAKSWLQSTSQTQS